MKKTRRSGSSGKSRSSSSKSSFSGKSSSRRKTPSQKGTSLFSRKSPKSASKGRTGKFFRPEEKKDRFSKPAHDPGPKIRPEGQDIVEGFSGEEDGNALPQALQNTGSGCCGSITGFFWLLAIGFFAVIIIFIVKCGGC
ncbi:MAG: hypothetical protein ABFR50_00965 [Candidatus Fermentibacteria bacterium]